MQAVHRTHRMIDAITSQVIGNRVENAGFKLAEVFSSEIHVRVRNEDARDTFYKIVDEAVEKREEKLTSILDESDPDEVFRRHYLVEGEGRVDGYLNLYAQDGSFQIYYCGEDIELAEKLYLEIEEGFKVFGEVEDDTIVPARISYYRHNQTDWRWTDISCPKWSDIKDNYSESVQESVESLMLGNVNTAEGRIIIWWGDPGTGKTHAIRALMRALKATHEPVVVTDPTRFLEHVDYYHAIVGESEKNPLIILEDAANALLAENRRTFGEEIGTLLNLTDGLLAQGREAVFLITFNEDLQELDRAITRSGRCMNQTKFVMLSATQAEAWLKEKGIEVTIDGDAIPLSDLYRIYRSHDPEDTPATHKPVSATPSVVTAE